jgi:RNA polymerase sigma factor (sigma-70 family)
MDFKRDGRICRRIGRNVIMDILTKYKDFLNRISNKYKYLGKEDIYNQAIVYLLEAYSDPGIKDNEAYALARIRTLVRKADREKTINYGLEINREESKSGISFEELLNKLTDSTQRNILNLYYNYGFTQKEIAESLGLSQQYVSKLYKKSLSVLNKKARTS